MIDVSRLGRVFGDRILVKKLERPTKRGGLFVPANYAETKKETDLWFADVVAFGLDSFYADAYALAVGEVIGIDALGSHSAAFTGHDGFSYYWVPEEFIACRDLGEIAAFYKDETFKGTEGIEPLGAYALVKPTPIEEKRGSIVLPQSASQPCRQGTVLSVSRGKVHPGHQEGTNLWPLSVQSGREILVGQYAGGWARLKTDYLLVKEEDIIAELEPVKEVASV